MYRKIQIATILLLISFISLRAEPYKPKPILFIHGIGSNSSSWGASTKDPNTDRSEWICKDSVFAHPEKAFAHFLPYMTPYAWAWYNWEKEREIVKSVNIFHSSVKILHTFGIDEIISNGIARLVILA